MEKHIAYLEIHRPSPWKENKCDIQLLHCSQYIVVAVPLLLHQHNGLLFHSRHKLAGKWMFVIGLHMLWRHRQSSELEHVSLRNSRRPKSREVVCVVRASSSLSCCDRIVERRGRHIFGQDGGGVVIHWCQFHHVPACKVPRLCLP